MSAQEFRDTLEFLAQTPQRVAVLVAGLGAEAARFRPGADAFSALEQICHLRDIEREGYTLRVKRILREDNPLLEDIDGGALAAARNYQAQDPAEALKAFVTAREETMQLFERVSAADLARPCRFEGSGWLDLAGLAGLMREHDRGHLAELEALREHLLRAQQAIAARIL